MQNERMDTENTSQTPSETAGETSSETAGPTAELLQPTGEIRSTPDGPVLHLSRTLHHPRSVVWDHLTDPTLLGGWYGTWTGDPASGTVMLAMVEAPDNPGPCTIRRCEKDAALELTLDDRQGNDWQLDLALEEGSDGGTLLSFDQPLAGFESMAADVGPGWEYYLDRLSASLDGRPVEDVVWEQYWPHQRELYAVD